jgi:sRNA-binding protein
MIESANQRVFENWLYATYPTVFRLKKPIPLAIGTGEELLKQLPDNVTVAEFKAAMSWYCRRTAYHKGILKHKQRINLQGEMVGEVTENDKRLAQDCFDRIQKKYADNKKTESNKEIPMPSEPIETMQPTEEIKPTKLTLKRKTVEPTADAKPDKAKPIAPAKVTTGNIATAKGLKVTMVIDPASIPNIDSTGMKKVTLTINVANSDIQVTTEINAKSYRKALSSIEEFGVDGCNAIIQGAMKQYDVIDEAGLVVQPKKTASSEA